MNSRPQAIRGMHDVLMQDTPHWQYLEATIQAIFSHYGYQELRLPIVEKTALFIHSIGSDTDIVAKEMYSFNDKDGTSLALRPEGTASCVRAGLQHGLFHNQIQRLWYQGAMFRRERPQKGRQRQFHQMGVEAFGLTGPDIDAELILMSARIWKRLNLSELLRLELNCIGTSNSRAAYRKKLVEYFSDYKNDLDEDSLKRLETNPLRILDSKNPAIQQLIESAPAIADYLDAESAEHFAQLTAMLDSCNIQYHINHRLVRGLDYYTRTVFEWVVEESLGAQNTVCAGGRYDDLVSYYGGTPTPAVGFAIGMERLLALVNVQALPAQQPPHVYMLLLGPAAANQGPSLGEELRDKVTGLKMMIHCGGGSLKSQLKKADKLGAELALILTDEELYNNQVTIKFLRSDSPQVQIQRTEIVRFICANLSLD